MGRVGPQSPRVGSVGPPCGLSWCATDALCALFTRLVLHQALESGLRRLEERCARAAAAGADGLRAAQAAARTLREGLEGERAAREVVDARKSKELELVESALALELEAERRARAEGEAHVKRACEERVQALAAHAAALRSAHAPAAKAASAAAAKALSAAGEGVASERRACAANADRIATGLAEEVAKLEELIATQAAARRDTEGNLLGVIAEAAERIAAEVRRERSERQAAEEMLLQLLENTVTYLGKD